MWGVCVKQQTPSMVKSNLPYHSQHKRVFAFSHDAHEISVSMPASTRVHRTSKCRSCVTRCPVTGIAVQVPSSFANEFIAIAGV